MFARFISTMSSIIVSRLEGAARVGVVLVPVDAAERERPAVRPRRRRRGSRRGGSRSRAAPTSPAERQRPAVQARRLGAPRLDRHARGLTRRHPDAELGHLHDGRRSRHPPAGSRCPSAASKSACTKWSSMAPAGRSISSTSRKMPGSHHMSWSSRYVPADQRCTRTASTFAPGPHRRVELERQPAARRPAELDPVQPHLRARVDALEAQHRRAPVGRHVEDQAVVAGGILGRDAGGIERDRVGRVRVQRPLGGAAHRAGGAAGERRELLEHPVRRNRHRIPARVVESRRRGSPRRSRRRSARAGTATRR